MKRITYREPLRPGVANLAYVASVADKRKTVDPKYVRGIDEDAHLLVKTSTSVVRTQEGEKRLLEVLLTRARDVE